MKKLLFIALFISLVSCAVRKSQLPRDVESQFNYAMELFNKGKYSKAIEIFKNIVFNYPTSEYVDKAQYYLAKSYKESRDYDDAILEYQFLISTFPTSEYAEIGYIELAESYLKKSSDPRKDLKNVHLAIKYAKDFLARYPDSPYREKAQKVIQEAREILAERLLYIAETYEKLNHFNSALVYIDILLEEYPDVPAHLKAQILKAAILLKQGKMEEARTIVQNLERNNIKDKKYQKKLNSILHKLNLK